MALLSAKVRTLQLEPFALGKISNLSRVAAFECFCRSELQKYPAVFNNLYPCSGTTYLTTQASGSGRRARAPSRKLLEASGALEIEQAQWMTREIKEADTRVKRAAREQRKHFKAAAGLKAGEVIEVFTATQVGGDVSAADTGIEGGKSSSSSGNSGSGLPNKQSRLRQARAKHQQYQAQWSKGDVSADAANISAKKEAVEAFPETTADQLTLKRAWVVSVPNGSARGGRSAVAEGDATESTPKRSKGPDGRKGEGDTRAVLEASDHVSAGRQKITKKRREESKGFADAGEGRGSSSAKQPKCEFGDCSETASFGVNGTVRYW